MINSLHHKDAYKIGHIRQYPEGTTEIYSNFTARSGDHSNIPGTKGVYFVGLQYFIIDFLIDEFNRTFFSKNKEIVVSRYKRRVSNILNYDVDVAHIAALHDLQYLPIEIKALPEGSFVPYGVPMLTIRNTKPEFYWLTNMLESVMSSELWQPITTATTYMAYKKLFIEYAIRTGAPVDFVSYQGHDFSSRGMAGRHAAAVSGFAVLACGGVGTDCVSAVDIAEEYYFADSDNELIAGSVNATEHSVMCAGGEDDELKTFKRLLNDIYPNGIVSVVSDSWDFFKVVTEYLPELHSVIMNRDGKLVIRPDSGDPVNIICGDLEADKETPEHRGLIELLWEVFGGDINEKGYKVLNPKIGAIYGDSITYQRAEKILSRLEEKGFASCNIVMGIGSYTFQHVTRDTHGMAVKSTYAVINGKGVPIFKNPKTDNGVKKSAKGLLMVSHQNGFYELNNDVTPKQEKHGCLEVVFKDGNLVKKQKLKEIRKLTEIN